MNSFFVEIVNHILDIAVRAGLRVCVCACGSACVCACGSACGVSRRTTDFVRSRSCGLW